MSSPRAGTSSPVPTPSSSSTFINRHALTASESQRAQLDRLLKDPAKPVHIPQGPKEKTIRPPREMMKNVQGSSAGAGSGEFHVYKAARRREYERLKLMEETTQKEVIAKEFEEKQRRWREAEEAKTAKNRAKRQKKKERVRQGGGGVANIKASSTEEQGSGDSQDAPIKKRRLVNGAEIVFKRRGEDDEDEDDDGVGPRSELPAQEASVQHVNESAPAAVANETKITIIEDE